MSLCYTGPYRVLYLVSNTARLQNIYTGAEISPLVNINYLKTAKDRRQLFQKYWTNKSTNPTDAPSDDVIDVDHTRASIPSNVATDGSTIPSNIIADDNMTQTPLSLTELVRAATQLASNTSSNLLLDPQSAYSNTLPLAGTHPLSHSTSKHITSSSKSPDTNDFPVLDRPRHTPDTDAHLHSNVPLSTPTGYSPTSDNQVADVTHDSPTICDTNSTPSDLMPDLMHSAAHDAASATTDVRADYTADTPRISDTDAALQDVYDSQTSNGTNADYTQHRIDTRPAINHDVPSPPGPNAHERLQSEDKDFNASPMSCTDGRPLQLPDVNHPPLPQLPMNGAADSQITSDQSPRLSPHTASSSDPDVTTILSRNRKDRRWQYLVQLSDGNRQWLSPDRIPFQLLFDYNADRARKRRLAAKNRRSLYGQS